MSPLPIGAPGYMTRRDVLHRFSISTRTLYRWMASDAVRFPEPAMIVDNRSFWDQGAVLRWEGQRRANGPRKGFMKRRRKRDD
jgi:predicted DNA-binding transcriptional regulator AlpA